MEEINTEERIRSAAKKLFFHEGRINARMQEIADKAGINRALLHYYFRNRESLFELTLKEAIDESFMAMFRILSSDKPFETKIREAVHHIVDKLYEYPYIETFIISEINQAAALPGKPELIVAGKKFTAHFLQEITTFLKKKKRKHSDPMDFMVDMMALCAYPASTKPIVKNVLGLSNAGYKTFIMKRKKKIVDRLLH